MKQNHAVRARTWPSAAILPLVVIVLAACGQKGPLVLPGQSKDTPWPVRTANPAPVPVRTANPVPEQGGPKDTGAGNSANTSAPAADQK